MMQAPRSMCTIDNNAGYIDIVIYAEDPSTHRRFVGCTVHTIYQSNIANDLLNVQISDVLHAAWKKTDYFKPTHELTHLLGVSVQYIYHKA